MKQRILQLIKLLDIKQAQFCAECGIPAPSISAMEGNLATANIIKIARRYPNLNLRWLLLGEGPIFLDGEPESPVLQPSFVAPQNDPEIAFLRDMVSKQHDTIQRLISNIEKNYKGNGNNE